MKPGMYEDLAYEKYAAIDAMNHGTLGFFNLSPAHVRSAMRGQLDYDTKDRKFGRAVHTKLLEPDLWDLYPVAERCGATLKSGDREGDDCGANSLVLTEDGWRCGKHNPLKLEPPPDLISTEERERIEQMAKSVTEDSSSTLLGKDGPRELSIVWERDVAISIGNEQDGFDIVRHPVLLKGRIDKLIHDSHGNPIIVDIKKAGFGKTTTYAVRKSITELKYFVQAAMYCEGIKTLTGKAPAFIWIFIEEKPPYTVHPVQAELIDLKHGADFLNEYFTQYAMCLHFNKWPGPANGEITRGGLTEWELKVAQLN